jgi:muramoyltetrapeptide carboxypeptidase
MISVRPPFLNKNDKIKIVAPASPFIRAEFDKGRAVIEKFFNTTFSDSIFLKEGYLAGQDRIRHEDLQNALNSKEIKAIIAARGGFGTTRILDRLDWSAFLKNPKWLAGCSDLTALLATAWARFKIVSIHGPMVAGFTKTYTADVQEIFNLLAGGKWSGENRLKTVKEGCAKGPMIGGNLVMLAHLAGTLPGDFGKGAILFLEDVNEPPYRLDRCLVQLKRTGLLFNAAGIVLGEFEKCGVTSDKYAYNQALLEHLMPLGIPVAKGYPAAHGKRNKPFLYGATVLLKAENKTASLMQI